MVQRRLRLGAALATTLQFLRVGAHYGQPPCGADEIQGEVQGASGYVCAPKCSQDSYTCPTDVPGMANAQPQCMLQDLNKDALCGLLCQVDSQCPAGAQCKTIKQMEVGVCLFPISFADWARQGNTAKLAIGWPSQGGGRPLSFQISKTQTSLQNLRSRYSIGESDADMVILTDLLNSLKGPGSSSSGGSSPASSPATPGQVAAPAAAASPSGSSSGSNDIGITHDVNQFASYANDGIPGFEREMHDTLWNIEHIDRQNSATHLFSGAMWIILLYIGVGSLFKYQQGARGCDMIPHLEFWAEYPKLVNDGVIYFKILLGVTPIDSSLSGGLSGGLSGVPKGGAGSFEAL